MEPVKDLQSKKSKILRGVWLGIIGFAAAYILYMIFIGDRIKQQKEAEKAATEMFVTE